MICDVVLINPIKKEIFKYYQINIEVGGGLEGSIKLNNTGIFDFSKSGGSSSDNRAQTLLENGANEVTLELKSIDKEIVDKHIKLKSMFNSNYFILKITINGMNKKDFASEENEIIRIRWNPDNSRTEKLVKFKFNLKREK